MNYLKTIKEALNKSDKKTNTPQEIIDTCELIKKIAWAMYVKNMHKIEWKAWEAIQCLVEGIKSRYEL